MLGNDDDFEMAFAKTDKEIKKDLKQQKPRLNNDQIENLLQQSKIFLLNDLEFTYKDSDPIFYTRDPVSERRQLSACLSCYLKFTDSKQMCYCQFCGFANCKDCLKKQRAFYEDKLNDTEVS